MWSVLEYDVCMVCVPFAECAKFVQCVNLVERVPAQVCEYDICAPCVNFPSLGDKGLEWYIDGSSIDDLPIYLLTSICKVIAMSISASLINL